MFFSRDWIYFYADIFKKKDQINFQLDNFKGKAFYQD